MSYHTVYKKVTSKWYITVTYMNYGTKDIPNDYSIYIRYNYKNFMFTDFKCSRNQLMNNIINIKKQMILETKLKPYRMEHQR